MLGLVRTVGNGEATRIFGDLWVPGLEYRRLLPREGILDFKANVNCLFDVSGRWRMEVMQQILSAEEIATIMKLPHNARRCDDRWTWALTSHGGFTVKSTYHACHSSTPSLATDVEYSSVWQAVWKMNTLPITKLFMWRAGKDILPTAGALQKRGIDINDLCLLCGAEVETCFHALVGCEQVRSNHAMGLKKLGPILDGGSKDLGKEE
ncbi:uncharacterized protein G2W53_010745 [Senna tora]|uniref:Reverse transcriptase zinc-binding domain-containing protein n=1 Tax=Senna tora TaxID=362788 RepID=A0A835C9T5_9FABA|nr:uncharacterized protein G2W53_010745 [Senna tora]